MIYSHQGPIFKQGLTLIPAWVNDNIASEVWAEIIYPFPNFNCWSLAMDAYFRHT